MNLMSENQYHSSPDQMQNQDCQYNSDDMNSSLQRNSTGIPDAVLADSLINGSQLKKKDDDQRNTFTVDKSPGPSTQKSISAQSSASSTPQQPLWDFNIGWNRFQNPGDPDPPMDRRFRPNSIRTSKYTNLTFFPLNILHQLSKGANIYYIIIIVMQMVKPISITGGSPTNLPPLALLIAVSMVKDFIEDRRRQKSDSRENNSKALRIEPSGEQGTDVDDTPLLNSQNCLKSRQWRELKTGDLVKVTRDQYFPADLILLKSSQPKGIAFVETKSLDGETNLKNKIAPKQIDERYDDMEKLVDLFKGRLQCQAPNDQIYKFEGTIEIEDGELVPLIHENFLLRGSSLKNTDWIIGVVTHTGHDTRIMKNSVGGREKFSALERKVSRSILHIFLIECGLCSVAATWVLLWNRIYQESTDQYLDLGGNNNWEWYNYILIWLQAFGTWIILFTNMVPISLLVTLEVVKYWQAQFISWDIDIYDTDRDMETLVQTSNLNEELGQVAQVFSDKTGTLTQNVMEFRKFSAGLNTYGNDEFDNKPAMKSKRDGPLVSNVNFHDENFYRDFVESNPQAHENITRMLINLAINHTVVAEQREIKEQQNENAFNYEVSKELGFNKQTQKGPDLDQTYNASSPDELALVNAAKFFGFTYLGRDEENNVELHQDGRIEKYKLLNLIEFDSTRKRMTSVFRDQMGTIKVMCKGADSVLLPLLKKPEDPEISALISKTNEYLDQYAKTGLRTLLIVEKTITDQEYEVWSLKYKNAAESLTDRDLKLEKVAEELERDFDLVGSTAIEDKLQEGVPETIEHIKAAGIKLWVLTGDKIETAINIGYSCRILDDSINQFIIDAAKPLEIYKQICIAENKQNLYMGQRQMALIVGGDSLLRILKNDKLQDKFVKLSEMATVVLACRVSPKQKAEIVELARSQHPLETTLAIGDGANDVNMITAAHVGIGISGLEGQQAKRASDYAISKFCYLKPLLFYHGREAYRRNALLCLYMFYKNILYVIPQYWYGFASAFSGQTLYESWLYQGYNIVFTAFPIMWFAIFDQEFEKKEFVKDPYLYWIGISDACYTYAKLWRIVFQAIGNALIIDLFVFWSLNGVSIDNKRGDTGCFWESATLVYACVVIVANLFILQRTNTHTVGSTLLIVLSIALFFVCFWFENLFFFFYDVWSIFPELMGNFKTYTIIVVTCLFTMGQDAVKSRYKQRQEEQRRMTIMKKLEQESKSGQAKGGKVFEESGIEQGFDVSRSMVQREIQRELMETNRVLSEDLKRQKSMKQGRVADTNFEPSFLQMTGDDTGHIQQRRGTGFSFSGEAGNDRLLVEKTMKTFNQEVLKRSQTEYAMLNQIEESNDEMMED